jgi:protein-tyrosine phosphatase
MDTSDKLSILIVCHANVSRSVMAEAILRKMLEERGVADRFAIESGGVAYYARDGALASLDARLALEEIGIEISSATVSTDLKRQRHLVREADIIFAMTDEQIAMIAEGFPEAADKAVYTLKQFAGTPGNIDDPQGQDESVFRACREEIHDCLRRSIDRLIERTES